MAKRPKTKTCAHCKKRFALVKPLHQNCALCQVRLDEEAIQATLEQCGGNPTLSTLIVHYQAYEEFWNRYFPLVKKIKDADKDADKKPVIPFTDGGLIPINAKVGSNE